MGTVAPIIITVGIITRITRHIGTVARTIKRIIRRRIIRSTRYM